MSGSPIKIGANSAFFIGTLAATGTPLTRVTALRQDGYTFKDETPSEWLAGMNIKAQTGPREVSLEMTFLTDNDLIYKISRQVAVEGSANDDTEVTTQYVLFIANPDPKGYSYILHEVSVESASEVPYSKTKATAVRIKFAGRHNRTDYDLLTRGTLTTLNTSLGVRKPLNLG